MQAAGSTAGRDAERVAGAEAGASGFRAARTLIVSDIHLSPHQPRTAAAFLRFIAAAPQRVGRVVILGDLFEYWAGDDDLDAPFHREVGAVFRGLGEAGSTLAIMRGNRDFLMGPAAAADWGATLLEDPERWQPGSDVLLSHGDALCTDDTDYMAFRAMVRAPAWQAEFLAKPLAERKQIIEGLRARSESIKGAKPMALMDVAPDAVRKLFEQSGARVLIHGHTHRPAQHVLKVDGRNCRRVVLTDWDFENGASRGGGVLVSPGEDGAVVEVISASQHF